MKYINPGYFYDKLVNKKPNQYPWIGQVELTHCCNLDCIHCYYKGSEAGGQRSEYRELTTEEWKGILNEIHREGCLWLTFTGGEPLIREDFLEIYSYAKAKGFIITIFTNGQLFTEEIIDYLEKSPPEAIEITLNGITEIVYESITQVKGSFKRVMSVIKKLSDKNLFLILKSNCLRQNKDEINRIKAFTDGLLGKGNKKWRFRYDPLICARFNGDTTPCNYRLSPEELLEVRNSDSEIWEEYKRGFCDKFPDLERDKEFLYHCDAWLNQFFINPYGRLKFCLFSDKFSVDLREQSFAEGFYNVFPQLLKGRFKSDSKCKDCFLRPICHYCPARAYLETGDEEGPVPYYCALAEETYKQMKKTKNYTIPNKVKGSRKISCYSDNPISYHSNEIPVL